MRITPDNALLGLQVALEQEELTILENKVTIEIDKPVTTLTKFFIQSKENFFIEYIFKNIYLKLLIFIKYKLYIFLF